MCLRGVVKCVFSVVMQRSSLGGALRDDTKNGFIADYPRGVRRLRQYDKVSSTAGEVQIKVMGHLTISRSRNV